MDCLLLGVARLDQPYNLSPPTSDVRKYLNLAQVRYNAVALPYRGSSELLFEPHRMICIYTKLRNQPDRGHVDPDLDTA